MKKNLILTSLAVSLLLGGAVTGLSATVGVGNSTAPWAGYMNVFDLGGNYQWGNSWAVGDLVAEFNDPLNQLKLKPNSIGDPDPYWYTPSGGPGSTGNKLMEANLYQEYTDVYNGQTVTFQGTVLANILTTSHVAKIFIRDFAPDYSSFNTTIVPLVPGPFSISLATDPGAGRHVQYGFQVYGPCVWITDVGPYGFALVSTIPEPASLTLLALLGLACRRR